MFFHNLNRFDELDGEKITTAAQALLRLPPVPVLKALAIVWSLTIVITISGIYAVRFAFNIPLPF